MDIVKKVETGQTHRPRRIEDIAEALCVSPGWLAHNSADLDKLESWAVGAAIQIQELRPEDRKAVLSHIAALRRNK